MTRPAAHRGGVCFTLSRLKNCRVLSRIRREPQAETIANAIVAQRAVKPIERTKEPGTHRDCAPVRIDRMLAPAQRSASNFSPRHAGVPGTSYPRESRTPNLSNSLRVIPHILNRAAWRRSSASTAARIAW